LKIICVTGGIGSGKSTVLNILEVMGASVINSDQISREVVAKGGKALDELVEHFGSEILNCEGELNRKKLGQLVFGDSKKLEILDSITTNKYIKEKIEQKIEYERKTNQHKVLAIEAIVPFDEWFRALIDETWVVISDIELRIKRVIDRSGLSYREVLQRIQSQKSDEEYLKIADEIIFNNKDFEELKSQVIKKLER